MRTEVGFGPAAEAAFNDILRENEVDRIVGRPSALSVTAGELAVAQGEINGIPIVENPDDRAEDYLVVFWNKGRIVAELKIGESGGFFF